MMFTTPWLKVFLDLWEHRGRTLIVALAIAVGVYAVGVVLDVREIITREYRADQAGARVASAVLYTAPFEENLAESAAPLPLVAAAEGRTTVRGRVYGRTSLPQELILVAVPDFAQMQVDALVPLSGQYPPGSGEVVLERLSFATLDARIGGDITVELDNDATRRLHVVGGVHDAQEFSPSLTGAAAGYVTLETLQGLGYPATFSELHVRATAPAHDKAHIVAAIDQVEAQLKRSDRTILSQRIITRAPADAYIDAVVLILTGFGFVILLLSGFLVVNAITALITQQVPQIGVMKLVGARRGQITLLYLATVLIYGILAVSIAVPLAAVSARLLMTQVVEKLLNVRTLSYAVPLPLLVAQVAVGLLLPLAAGLAPVIRGTAVSTHQALNDAGLAHEGRRTGPIDRVLRWLQKAQAIRRPVLLAIRNTLRHKGRLAQTLIVLIFGTALFISVLSVRVSVAATLDSFMRFHRYDVSLALKRPQLVSRLEAAAREVPGVTGVEVWALGSVHRVRADDSKSEAFRIVAVPAGTAFMDPELRAGRWLPVSGGPANPLVVNSDFVDGERDVQVGTSLVLEIAGRKATWTVVGIVPTESRGSAVYANLGDYAYATRSAGQGTHVQVRLAVRDAAAQQEMSARLREHFDARGLEIEDTQTAQRTQNENETLFTVVVAFLILMALLLAAVGGLGLATTMSINMMERVREIGVLRAIGASNASVRTIVLAEGLAIAAISWAIGTALSVFLSPIFSEALGVALIKIPLRYHYSLAAALIWIFILLGIAVAASLGPARNAVRLTVREVLAYE